MSAASNTAEPLYLGIDLGTSRSVIAASNGVEAEVLSIVGWPKDFVAQRALGGREVLFGAEALEQRSALDLYRPLEDGVLREGTPQEERAVAALIAHLIELSASDGRPLRVAVGVPAECLRINKLAIRTAVGAHADKLMVVAEPFAVAYGLGALMHTIVVDIGAGTVDFCVMRGTVPGERELRSLLTAGNAIDQRLYELLRARFPEASVTLNMARQFKETYGFVGPHENPIKVRLPVAGKLVTYNITEEVERACFHIVPPIVETLMDLIGAADPEHQEALRGNILLAGGGSQLRGLAACLTRELERFEPCSFRCVPDPIRAGARGALALIRDMPEAFFARL